jgi:hypothetical protein
VVRLAALVLACVGCGRIGFATIAGDDAAAIPGLVGWWKLDETAGSIASDASGNGHDGALKGSPSWVAAKTGNGIRLDGTTQYVDIPDSPTLRLEGSWTIATWVQLSALPATTKMYTLLAKTDGAGNETYSLRVDNNYGQFGVTAPGSFVAQFATATATDVYALITPPSIDAGAWYWLAGTWDASSGQLALYVDGQLAASVTSSKVPTTGSGQDFLIGDNAGHLAQYTPGILDDVRIYDRALTAGELAMLFSP